jgi:phenylacetate-CoA ligase
LFRLLHPKRSASFLEMYDHLIESQWWSLEQLRAHQAKKLDTLLTHAFDTVPYYSQVFQERGITKSQLSDYGVLEKLPILSKKIIQENFDQLKSVEAATSDLVLNSTGGSTGSPLNFYQDVNYSRWSKPAMARAWKNVVGVDIDASEAVLWGAIRDIGKEFSLTKTAWSFLRNRRLSLNTFDLNHKKLHRFIRLYNFLRPEVVRGYATSLAYAAEYIESRKLKVHSPKAIISSTEVLHSRSRDIIERVFGARVFDSYGCREIGQIATECQMHDGLHIVMENQIVELIGEKILVTNLHNLAMPFIRYEVGDLASGLNEAPCSCGRKSVRLTKLVGRDNDNIVIGDSTIINGEFFEFLFFGCRSVRQYQVVHLRKSDRLEVRVSLRDKSEDIHGIVRRAMKENFNFDRVDILETEIFDKTPTGKLRFVYSLDK